MDRKRQGDLGVAAAIMYYTSKGYDVSVPLTDATRYDLIVDNGTIHRVQCKATGYTSPHGVYAVDFRTQGGNRSGVGTMKTISDAECDRVFVYTLGGDMYDFPVATVAGKSQINLGKLQEPFKVS
jgi:hypothetical protein